MINKNRYTLITGASEFVGQHLLVKLEEKNIRIFINN
jgi:hypothetical protein|tara:strand:+ start:291 stop:401 length:111 start_codon:yes stop_codon:yes gene_type:complete